jgi:hypothetical protein
MALGRRPTPAERSALDDFWADFSRRHARRVAAAAKGGDADADSLALAAYCQALFATAEFRHLH